MQTGWTRVRTFVASAMTLLVMFISGCIQKQPAEVTVVDQEELETICTALNSTVESLTKLVRAKERGLMIEMFAFKPSSSGVEEYTLQGGEVYMFQGSER